MDELDKAYWAGVVDSDGSVSLSLSIGRSKTKSILITPNMKIGWKEIYHQTLENARDLFDLGKIYYSNKGKPHGICFWQTTNLNDAIKFAEILIPYLKIKKERTKKFLEICKYWKSTDIRTSKGKGRVRTRKKEDIERIVKIAITMNEDRQTERWRGWRGWDYWKQKIAELYS